MKNIPFGSVITSFTGLRATTKNGDFLITAPKPNFLNLAGIDSPGLTAAPAIAVHVSNMLKDMGLELVEKKDYTSTRKIYQVEKSRYNKMVCRCELVKEIIESHTNPKAITVDAIKGEQAVWEDAREAMHAECYRFWQRARVMFARLKIRRRFKNCCGEEGVALYRRRIWS